jgi:chromosome segregation and condensation protein ScpB
VNIAPSHARTKQNDRAATARVVTKTVVQVLFTTAKTFTVDTLREKLREFYREDARAEVRAAAAVTNVELVAMLLDCNKQLAPLGLQFRIVNGMVSLLTTKVENECCADYLRAQTGESGNPELTTAALEVLACIAFKQPISQAEIDQIFAADKRSLVVKLRDLDLVADYSGTDGRLRFATTGAFLRWFGLASLDQLRTTCGMTLSTDAELRGKLG